MLAEQVTYGLGRPAGRCRMARSNRREGSESFLHSRRCPLWRTTRELAERAPGPRVSPSSSLDSVMASSMASSRLIANSRSVSKRARTGSSSRKSSCGATRSAVAMRSMVADDGNRFIISMLPIIVAEQPTRAASDIWDRCRLLRYRFILRASSARTSESISPPSRSFPV